MKKAETRDVERPQLTFHLKTGNQVTHKILVGFLKPWSETGCRSLCCPCPCPCPSPCPCPCLSDTVIKFATIEHLMSSMNQLNPHFFEIKTWINHYLNIYNVNNVTIYSDFTNLFSTWRPAFYLERCKKVGGCDTWKELYSILIQHPSVTWTDPYYLESIYSENIQFSAKSQ